VSSSEEGKTMEAAPSDLPGDAPQAALAAKASQAYAAQSREALEQKWILDHLPLVRHIVSRVASQAGLREDLEDLISAGTLGLVKAARSFDPGREAEFKTYAYIRVRGAVLDELRSRTFVPSAVHSQVRRIRRAFEAHAAEHGKPPSDEELAGKAEMGLDQMYRVLEEARKQNFLSIHGMNENEPALGAFLPPDQGPTPEDEAERKELLACLRKAIEELPQRDRVVLLLYYERDLTMREAAQVLGVTESRISQLHASALFKLAMKLKRAAS
jgi:RNA polymerase sigma factor for flagellar operon FliA